MRTTQPRGARPHAARVVTVSLLLAASLLVAATLAPPAPLAAQATLSAAEQRIAARVDEGVDRTVALLEEVVNINSGTLNLAGNRAVYDALAPAFERLGFEVRWEALPSQTGRAGHLVAVRRGTSGQRLLLIGHIDTVFEPDSPFQTWVREGDFARGPGVADMKGGDLVMILALEAMHAEGALDGKTITVVMTGDEEAPGRPLDVTREGLYAAARNSDVALGFEPGPRLEGVDAAVIARRSSSSWQLQVEATSGHSMLTFSEGVGAGAIYEASRIFDTWYGEIRGERYLTFNVGTMVGGTEVTYDAATASGTAMGKTNVVPQRVIATGDIRTITDEQLQRVRARMRDVVEGGLPGARASITFTDGYPSMPPRESNQALLGELSGISQALGAGPVVAVDPGSRGAADISFVAQLVEAGIDGLGPYGESLHTVDERIDLRTIPLAAKRAAILMYRLTR